MKATIKKLSFALLTGLTLSAFSMGTVSAATATATFTVNLVLLGTCTVAATPMAFGSIYNSATALEDSQTNATVTVTCPATTPFEVGLTPQSTNSLVGVGNMSFTGSLVSYTLYKDAARSQVWGSTTGTNTVTGTAAALPTTYLVYGRIPAGQITGKPSGVYTDTVTVTLTY